MTSDLIRVGEALRGLPAVANHVAIITNQDQRSRWIGIQGQPGGVGLVDCTPWLGDSRTRSNHDQPDIARPAWHQQRARSAWAWLGAYENRRLTSR